MVKNLLVIPIQVQKLYNLLKIEHEQKQIKSYVFEENIRSKNGLILFFKGQGIYSII